MEYPQFSVSMCVYGGDNPEWFDAALGSVLNQTVKPTEVVLVVDGPVPVALDAVITEYEKRAAIKVIRLAENGGHGNARRVGLEACTYELVAIMDADDICAHDRFEQQLAFFADSDVAIVGGNITEFVGEPTNIVGCRVVPKENAAILVYMKMRCPMNLVTVMFKKSAVERVGGFIDWYCEEDYYLWLRMAQAGMTFANIDAVLVNVRVGKEMYSRRGGLRYFKSEAKLQKYMLDTHVINLPTYLSNISKRLIVQVLLPNKVRGWVFKKFARNRV